MSAPSVSLNREIQTQSAPPDLFLPKMVSDAGTQLTPQVTLQWVDGYTIGSGMNAVTGGLGGPAIENPQLKDATTKRSNTRFHFVKTESQLQQEIQLAAKGAYNMGGVKLSPSASYVNKIKLSELHISLVAQYHSRYVGYDEIHKPELTANAKELINSDHEKFRSIYGDYFIAGQERGSSFNAVYNCHADSAESMNKFMASVGADTPKVFSAEGSAKFVQAAKDFNIDIEISLDMYGYPADKTPPKLELTPAGIIKALEWFKENEQGAPENAMLWHFSILDPNFSPEVPVDPQVFAELSVLYTTRLEIVDAFNSIPPFYQQEYEARVKSFDAGVTASAHILAKDADLRNRLSAEAKSLLIDLRNVLLRQDFYYKVLAKKKYEPKEGEVIDETDDGPQMWQYGINSYPGEAVTLQSISERYHKDWTIGHREHTFVWDLKDRLIVGWQVWANYQGGYNGSWNKACPEILLGSVAQIHVQSLYDRGCDWTVVLHYVDAKDYQFGS